MGITRKDSQFLFHASKNLGVSFNETLTLGRLYLYASQSEIADFKMQYGVSKGIVPVSFDDEYAEPLFKILGANEVDSLDYSNYEKASIIHDLNQPLPKNYLSRYTSVVDGGTIEHVFNFPMAIKNCMTALAVGGHFIGITPANNQMGHGFYQFSPELYYRIFSEENGFRVKQMLITPSNAMDEWYEVADPAKVRSRVTLVNNCPVTLMLVAEKIREAEAFERSPFQSDYSTSWQAAQSMQTNLGTQNLAKQIYQKVVPKKIRSISRNIYDMLKMEKMDTQQLGSLNQEHFKKINI